MDIIIGPYEAWMKPQVAKMFSMQYSVPEDEFASLLDNFYDHPYQANRCIRVTAREGDTIIGFQSFFHWPYTCNGKTYNSYQSGNSLVHPEHRGKGLFQKLLNYVDTHREELKIDFLMGFPVEESRNSFIRNKWYNILDLKWHVKVVNPLAVLFANNTKRLSALFSSSPLHIEDNTGNLRLSQEESFLEWRKAYSRQTTYYYFRYNKGNDQVVFQLKTLTRKKIIRELVIGDVRSTSYSEPFLAEAFKALARKARKARCIAFLSIAVNEVSRLPILPVLAQLGFRSTQKKIYFIVKPFTDERNLLDPASWVLYRSDIDTW